MDDDRKRPPDELEPANDNAPKLEAEGERGENIAPWQKLDRVVFDIARLIGRQMAREDFERLRAATANENTPRRVDEDEADKD